MLYLLCGAAALAAAEIRDDDVIYLDEWKQPAFYLKTLYRAPITFTRDRQSILAYLAPGEVVEVIALGETQHYVTARIATGATQGWVDAQALEAPPAGLVAKLRARREKAQAHREMIERHEVAVAMTRAEVRDSLGKPERTSRRQTQAGEEEQWFYTVYKYLPHYIQAQNSNGQVQQVVSYRREPAGDRIITFRNGEVAEIAEEPKENAHPPTVIVASPVRSIN
jgi:hypothetical protein